MSSAHAGIGMLLGFALGACSGDPGQVFSTAPAATAQHNREYRYAFALSATGRSLTFEADLPPWLELDSASRVIKGTPGWDNLNQTFRISLRALDGVLLAEQRFAIRVVLGEIVCEQPFGDPATSQYILPFKAGESYRVNQSYCPTNPAWGHHNWFAYDFEQPIGTDVIAMRAGLVIATQSDREDNILDCGSNSGNYIFILHDDGTVGIYAHLTKGGVLVNKDQRVTQGQTIGISGNSGCSSGPHLHVNVYRQRAPYERQYTLPFNFSNADGLLDSNNGLAFDRAYKAR